MAVKFVLLFLAVFIVFLFTNCQADIPSEGSANKIKDDVNVLSTDIKDMLAKVKGNDSFQSLAAALENFDLFMEKSGKDLVSTVQDAVKKVTPPEGSSSAPPSTSSSSPSPSPSPPPPPTTTSTS